MFTSLFHNKMVIFLFFITFISFSQEQNRIRYQSFIKGDMAIVSNNIVNRVDYSNEANSPYYNHTSSSTSNDDFSMKYIDVDKDEATFSSSSAELILENSKNKKIVYAGLYWAATYNYNVGIKDEKGNFIASDSKRENFSNVKLKVPEESKYIEISGKIINDGIKPLKSKKEKQEFEPYIVYADITEHLINKSNPSGVYTVANIKATQGTIEGGIAGGWTIFIVYEDKTMSEKSITSFDGFIQLNEISNDLIFNGFHTISNGNVNLKIAGAAIEGDNNVIGDQLLFCANSNKLFKPLSTSIRNEQNFFNSSITIEDKYYTNRFPNSKNTLGYDTYLFSIHNPNNTRISNNANEVIIRYKSVSDKCFVFLTALSVEVEKISENQIINSSVSSELIEKDNELFTIKYIPANNDFLVGNAVVTSTVNRNKKLTTIGTKNKIIEIQTISISSQPSGYYIITNIYFDETKARQYIQYLKTKKINANFFTNPLSNYIYIYLENKLNRKEIIDYYLENSKKENFERMQILVVNKEELKDDIQTALISNKTIIEKPKEIVPKPIEKAIVIAEKPKETVPKPIEKTKIVSEKSRETLPKTIEKPIAIEKPIEKEEFEIQSIKIPNSNSGYLIIANVFNVIENTIKFTLELKSKGFKPKILFNPETKNSYVYLMELDTEKEAKEMCKSKLNNTYHDKIWILSVNN